MQFKKTYKFAFYTSLFIALLTTFVLGIFLYIQNLWSWYVLAFFVIIFWLSFFVIQHRVQNFIYKRVNKIYEDLTLLESAEFTDKKVTTDMATLTQEIDKYARDK